ncbi:MAG TPA: hypothetical protein VF139_06295 [Candidatus Polarisedimenticolaceae bacterium]
MTRWLSVHADYACRHRGACCEAGWAIPVEKERLALWRPGWRDRLDADGDLATAGGCPLRENDRCAVHRDLGPEALPAACRHFPRVCLRDLRGISVTLSCFCPTAAQMLFREDVALAVVEGPRPVPIGTAVEGLDARGATHVDLDALTSWEEETIDALDRDAHPSFRGEPRPVRAWLAARAFASWAPFQGDGIPAAIADLERSHSVLREERARGGPPVEAIRRAEHRLRHRA